MGRGKPEIRIGTSGWYYYHWSGLFYPQEMPKNKWFEYYCQHFDTVEINNTFYQLPKETSLKSWYKKAPEKFIYTVKANRYITHIKRLKDAGEPLARFLNAISLLKETLGPVLYQLPPGFHKDLDRLEDFLELLPKEPAAVFELRHKSWFSEDTYKLLEEFGAGFCTHDMPGIISPRIITGKIIYIRFHGPTGRYAGNYCQSLLQNWADWIAQNIKKVRKVYVYFNNDYNAYAVSNAKQLRELCLSG